MADLRNHRHFTLRCIKVRLTPVSCKLKNPVQSAKCYHIIHKAERQLLYDRIRSINSILECLETHQFENYPLLREIITEEDMFTCIRLINKVKEHRHDKIKRRQTDKFKRLLEKNGYFHNFQTNNRCPPSSNNDINRRVQ